MSRVVHEARALLEQLRQSGWHDLHLRTTNFSLFIARPGGASNPMRERPVLAPAHEVPAPHIGTVAWIAQLGSALQAGAVVTRIELLGELIDIAAPTAGVVTSIAAPIGTLVEYGSPLVSLAAKKAVG
jgi:acetyl-CoA carboxylase biotin carboxyl carrier protein